MGSRDPRRTVNEIERQRRAALDQQYAPFQTALTGRFPQREIRSQLQGLVRAIDEGQSIPAALRVLRPQLQVLFEQYAPLIASSSVNIQRQAARLGIQLGGATLRAAGVTFGQPTLETLGAAISYVESEAFRSVIAGYPEWHARWIIERIAAGQNPRLIALQMATEYRFGLYDALRLTRTLQLYSARQGSMLLFQAQGVGQWQWAAALDLRTCPSCWMMHGRVFPITVFGPNDHHFGRCAAIPLVGDWKNAFATGEERFMELEPSQQRAILGNVRYAKWRDGSIDLADIPGVETNPIFGDMMHPQ